MQQRLAFSLNSAVQFLEDLPSLLRSGELCKEWVSNKTDYNYGKRLMPTAFTSCKYLFAMMHVDGQHFSIVNVVYIP